MDHRAEWDQLLDDAEPAFAFAARQVGDAVTVARSILRDVLETPNLEPHEVWPVAAEILRRVDAETAARESMVEAVASASLARRGAE